MYSELIAQEIIMDKSEIRNLTREKHELLLKAANYKALFYHNWDLHERIEKQLDENFKALRNGVFDGMCICIYNNVTYRTLEDMLLDGIITEKEYDFCLV